MKTYAIEFSKVLVTVFLYFFLKGGSTRNNFRKFLEIRFILTKKSAMDSYSARNLFYFHAKKNLQINTIFIIFAFKMPNYISTSLLYWYQPWWRQLP